MSAAGNYQRGRHRRTDPACHYHREPRNRFERWRYNRARGRSCELCIRIRELAEHPFWRRNGWRTWRDEKPGGSE